MTGKPIDVAGGLRPPMGRAGTPDSVTAAVHCHYPVFDGVLALVASVAVRPRDTQGSVNGTGSEGFAPPPNSFTRSTMPMGVRAANAKLIHRSPPSSCVRRCPHAYRWHTCARYHLACHDHDMPIRVPQMRSDRGLLRAHRLQRRGASTRGSEPGTAPLRGQT